MATVKEWGKELDGIGTEKLRDLQKALCMLCEWDMFTREMPWVKSVAILVDIEVNGRPTTNGREKP